jgi:hypothetical protein
MKNYKLLSMLILGTLLFGSFGCAKDQTVAEYDNAQAAREAQQNLPAVAQWVGPVTSPQSGTVGLLQLNLQNQSTPVTANDNTTAQQTVLGGQAEFTNVPNSQATITSANFTPDSDNSNNGTLAAYITATDATNKSQTLTLTGTINGNTMNGQIEVQGDPSTLMNFVASKGASSTSQNLVITSKKAQFQNELYFSTQSPIVTNNILCQQNDVLPPPCYDVAGKGLVCPAPSPNPSPSAGPAVCERNIQMTIIEKNPVGEVNFFNVVTDQPTVQVDVAYYDAFSGPSAEANNDNLLPGTYLQLPTVTWDLDATSPSLSGSSPSGTGTDRLDCSANGLGWSCTITNLGATVTVQLSPGQLSTQTPAAGNH